ncbi:MAG: tetratricopeptide repeat protein [Planctomycetota bacterium]
MVLPVRKAAILKILILVFLMQVLLPAAPSPAGLRKTKIGDVMPEFSLPDSNGVPFTYKHGRNRVLAVAFMPTNSSQFQRMATEIEQAVADLQEKARTLDLVGVLSGPVGKEALESDKLASKQVLRILLDNEYGLWGRLGVIAVPTVLIVGKDDKILWIKAGYDYNFVPVARVYLNKAFGIAQETTAEDAAKIKTVANYTVAARAERHLQMAKMFEDKGQIDSAIAETQKAIELDPNSVETVLELGALLCKAGRSKEALNVTDKLNVTKGPVGARRLLISGWAKRQLGNLEAAEKDLLDATRIDMRSGRGFFELGRVYQARGDKDKAMSAYYHALTLVFGEQ